MNLSFDHEEIEKSATEAVQQAIKKSFSSHKVQEIISESVQTSLIDLTVQKIAEEAVKQISMESLITVISKEMAEWIKTSILMTIEDSSVAMIAKLRGLKDYASDEDIKRIKNEIRKEMAERRKNES